LSADNLDAEDFAGLTLCPHFKGTATHFAICGELLAGTARIDQELECSSAERTLNGCACLHLLIPISSTSGLAFHLRKFSRIDRILQLVYIS